MTNTREPQYECCWDTLRACGRASFGLMSNHVWHDDPRRLTFLLARYKFVAKMVSGLPRVLEIGCADAFGTRLVLQEAGSVTAIDFDPVFIEEARQRMDPHWPVDCRVHDILDGPVVGPFEAAYALDVLEHIAPEHEERFLTHCCQSLTAQGILILGLPSLQSQVHASPPSRAGHVNCKDAPGLKSLMLKYFHHAFLFSMNDEVVHTGFYPMAHYLLALCTSKRLP